MSTNVSAILVILVRASIFYDPPFVFRNLRIISVKEDDVMQKSSGSRDREELRRVARPGLERAGLRNSIWTRKRRDRFCTIVR